jgi:hypothetical protein
VVVAAETEFGVDDAGSLAEALKSIRNQRFIIHGDNTELVFIVHPQEEGLSMVVEVASTIRPFTLQAGVSQPWVIILKESSISPVIFLLIFRHVFQIVKNSSEIPGESFTSGSYLFSDYESVLGIDVRS